MTDFILQPWSQRMGAEAKLAAAIALVTRNSSTTSAIWPKV